MKIRVGDMIVLKPLKVQHLNKDGDLVVRMNGCDIWISPYLIERIEPKPLKPGDDVLWPPKGNKKLRIIFIEGYDAWLADGEDRFTARLSMLTRV